MGFLALLTMPVVLVAQSGAAEERSAMAPASESVTELNTAQQANMKLLSAQRQQKQAQKYEDKAAAASSDKKQAKFKEKAKAAFEGAIRDYVAALRMDATLHEAFVGLGQLFAKAGQHDQSMESFQQALSLDPGNSEAMLGQARIQLATFKVEDAKTSYGELVMADGKAAGVLLAEMRAWLNGQNARLGPEVAQEVTDAMAALDVWISEKESS